MNTIFVFLLDFVDSALTIFWSLFELVIAMALIVFISGFLATHLISRYFRFVVDFFVDFEMALF